VRPRNVGCGSGGRTGDEPSSSSAVELVEKAGDSARAGRCSVGVLLPVPSSAAAAGGGDDCNEEIVWISHRDQRRRTKYRRLLCSLKRSAGYYNT